MARPDITNIFFQGRRETLEVFDQGRDLVKYLTNSANQVCPLLGASIRVGRVLGKGANGEVFLIEFDQGGTQSYALKKTEPLIELYEHIGSDITYADLDYEGLDAITIAKFNETNPHAQVRTTRKIRNGDVVKIPLFLISCEEDKSYPRLDGNGTTVIPPGSVVCQQAYTEFIISLLMGNVFRSGKSINFIDTFYFATCADATAKHEYSQYTFMDLIDGGSIRGKESVYAPHLDNLAIQTLHAIGVYQKSGKIAHNDLHDGNIFIKKVDDNMVWDGKRVKDATHFEYKIEGTSIYIPAGPYIVKIGDWGFGCKYTTPMIVNEDVMTAGMDQGDGQGAWMPNFYSESYDIIFSMLSLMFVAHGHASPPSVTKFIEDIVEEILYRTKTIYTGISTGWFFSNAPREKINVNGTLKELYFPANQSARAEGFPDISTLRLATNSCNNRPLVRQLDNQYFKQITPKNILLQSDCMKKYLMKPTGATNIILLGEF